MRTSLNEIEKIERYLFKTCSQGEKLIFEAQLIIDPGLRRKVALQRQAYFLLKNAGRLRLKEELNVVHQKLFTLPEFRSFQDKVFSYFQNR